MENLNWGYLQLGLVALAFGGLQVWWISSTLRKRTWHDHRMRRNSKGHWRVSDQIDLIKNQ